MFRLVFLSSVFLLQARGVALRQNRVWEGGGELYSLPVIIRFFWSACTFASTSRPDKTEVATRDVLCMYVCVCMCVCMYVCIYIYICRHVLIYITRPQAARRAMRIIDIMVGESCVSLTSIFPDCSLDHTHHFRALCTIPVRGRSSGSRAPASCQIWLGGVNHPWSSVRQFRIAIISWSISCRACRIPSCSFIMWCNMWCAYRSNPAFLICHLHALLWNLQPAVQVAFAIVACLISVSEKKIGERKCAARSAAATASSWVITSWYPLTYFRRT